MDSMNLIGTRLGHFDIRDELGQGGMGAVYKAQQTDLDRTVALKVLLPHLTYDTSYIKRFRQEARSAARLEHPHIVPIYEVGEASVVAGEAHLTGPLPPLHYIAMKFIQGHTLKDAMEGEQPLSVAQVLDIMTQVSSALDYAHQNGMIHRDIKPSNIMITREGWVYLTDFGLAREVASTADLTRTGTVMGTPEYMSPEQAEGLPGIGPATDIYALGVVLYQALSNALPFEADTPMAMLAARLVQAPRPLREARSELPPAIEAVVMRALARQPDDRYRTASEMIDALRKATEQWGAHMATVALPASTTAQSVAPPPSPPSPPSPPPPSPLPPRKRLGVTAGIGAVLLLFLLVGAVLVHRGKDGHDLTPTPIPTHQPATPVPTAIGSPTPPPAGTVSELVTQGWELMDREAYTEAEQVFHQALSLDSGSYEAMTGLGWSLYYQDKYDEAMGQFQASLLIQDEQPDAHNGLGWCLYNLHRFGLAIQHFERATTLDPTNANAYYGLGQSLDFLGRTELAERAYRKALEIDPTYEDAQRALDRLGVK